MTCQYEKKQHLFPCQTVSYVKNVSIEEFINGKGRITQSALTGVLDCIRVTSGINIDQSRCVKCLYCFMNCPGERISIDSSLRITPSCDTIKEMNYDEMKARFGMLLKGELLEINNQNVELSAKYRDFNHFTSENENTNISVWLISVLTFLAGNMMKRIGKEIKLNTLGDRDSRLDVCLLTKNDLYCFECKRSFEAMINENRYRSQLVSYNEALMKIRGSKYDEVRKHLFLVIGGDEREFLYPGHRFAGEDVGGVISNFYSGIFENRWHFISANALLAMVIKRSVLGDEDSTLDSILSTLDTEEMIGLLSDGFVTRSALDL